MLIADSNLHASEKERARKWQSTRKKAQARVTGPRVQHECLAWRLKAELQRSWLLDLPVQICFTERWLLLPKSLIFSAAFGDLFADIRGDAFYPLGSVSCLQTERAEDGS